MLPYERTIVYSGDQIGLACAGSVGAGLGVISRLLVGKEVAPELGAAGVLEQAHEARRVALSHKVSRGRLAPWLVGVPSVAITGLIVAVVVSGGGLSAATAASSSSSAATKTVNQSRPTLDAVSRSVAELTQIVNQSSLGRRAATAGDWHAAIDNRQQMLMQLKRLKLSPELTPFRQLLSAALTYSLLADQAMADCGGSNDCRQAGYYDSLATQSKRQFLVAFNRVMRAYGARQYEETDF